MGEYTRTGDGVPNLFGLTQFDGKTQFFDGDTYALPQVSLIDRVDCTSDARQSKRSNIALSASKVQRYLANSLLIVSALRLRVYSEMPGLLEFVVVVILQYSHESLLTVSCKGCSR